MIPLDDCFFELEPPTDDRYVYNCTYVVVGEGNPTMMFGDAIFFLLGNFWFKVVLYCLTYAPMLVILQIPTNICTCM